MKKKRQGLEALIRGSLGGLIREDYEFAEEVYAALCNMRWHRKDELPNSANLWSCTWRWAGGLVADIEGQGDDYMKYYCSGNEGVVSDRVAKEFAKLGYKPRPYPGGSQ